jgi:hypothetical protein
MRLYYTVSSEPEVQQTKPNLSLGGYKSSSPIQSSIIGNLFGDISMYTVKNNNQNQYIGLVLKNETGGIIENVKLWFDYNDDCYSNIKVASIDLSVDGDGRYVMERVSSINSKPIYAEFFEANTEVNAVDLGGLQVDETIGIWLKRSFLIDKIKEDQNNIYQKVPGNEYLYEEIVLDKEDNIELSISWDIVV